MIKLALEDAFDRVKQSFADNQINAANVFGWRELGRIDFELPTITWTPGALGGEVGELGGARNPGQTPSPVAQLAELFTVQIIGFDPRDIENERAQYRVARFLYEAWFVAMFKAASGNFRVRSQKWLRGDTTDRSFGATIQAVCEINAPIVDALPDEPLVGEAFAGQYDAVDMVAYAAEQVPPVPVTHELTTELTNDEDDP